VVLGQNLQHTAALCSHSKPTNLCRHVPSQQNEYHYPGCSRLHSRTLLTFLTLKHLQHIYVNALCLSISVPYALPAALRIAQSTHSPRQPTTLTVQCSATQPLTLLVIQEPHGSDRQQKEEDDKTEQACQSYGHVAVLETQVRTDKLRNRLRAGAVRKHDSLVRNVAQLRGDETVECPRDGAARVSVTAVRKASGPT
jgi:hypothetical protein